MRTAWAQCGQADATKTMSSAGRARACDGIDVLGPAPAPIARVKGHWRSHVLIKSPDAAAIEKAVAAAADGRLSAAKLIVDVDPMSLL